MSTSPIQDFIFHDGPAATHQSLVEPEDYPAPPAEYIDHQPYPEEPLPEASPATSELAQVPQFEEIPKDHASLASESVKNESYDPRIQTQPATRARAMEQGGGGEPL